MKAISIHAWDRSEKKKKNEEKEREGKEEGLDGGLQVCVFKWRFDKSFVDEISSLHN